MIYNYSSVFQRDSKVYEIGGVTLSDGIRTDRLKIMIPILLFFVFIGYNLGKLFGYSLFNVFSADFSLYYTTTILVLGLVVGIILYDVKITTIRLYEYLIAYFKPRKYYTNENHIRKRIYKPTTVIVDELFRSIL